VSPRPSDPAWYRDAVIYQVHVRSFGDSNGDGVGDFRGLTRRLDHLVDLGVTAVWLLPFYPSPLRDDGYDIADYGGINPSYGTLADFRAFLRRAHDLGLRVITELVLNHTSDTHPWFQRARRSAPGSRWRDYYVWSDDPDRYPEARIIFEDFETSNWAWDPVAGAYYFHRFFSHQPDLNYDNPEVRDTMLRVIDRWFEMGVDGVRLDAVPYLFERDGTNGENLPETHDFLRQLRAHVDANFAGRMLLAEANQWPEDAVAYFGDGDECHMAFHFPLMPRLYMAVRMEDRHPVIDILSQTPDIPDGAQWAIFLRTHDELTLEMVTDEERDYMYRAYAADPRMRVNLGIRRRLAPLMGNDRRKVELLNGLLFALPGTPVVYYGDEIGMGDNVYLGDRDAVRTPMQWGPDRNAGFSAANPQQLFLPVVIDPEYHYESVNVEAQAVAPSSLLNWMRRIISIRNRHPVMGRGAITFLYPENARVLAFVRHDADQRVLVVANLSRQAQSVHLDLHDYRGAVPVELFGGMAFPQVPDTPYHFTLGPYAFYWFRLDPQHSALATNGDGTALPELSVVDSWHELFEARGWPELRRALPAMLLRARWFAGRHRQVREVVVHDVVALATGRPRPDAWLCLVEVDYVSGEPDTYVLPLATVTEGDANAVLADRPESALGWVRTVAGERLLLVDALATEATVAALPDLLAARRRFRSMGGATLGATATPALRSIVGERDLPAVRVDGAHANSVRIYGDEFVVKLFRRVQGGMNPDLEVGRHLASTGFTNAPAVLGSWEYDGEVAGAPVNGGDRPTLAMVTAYVPNEGDAWHYTLARLELFIEAVLGDPPVVVPAAPPLAELGGGGREAAPAVDVHIASFLDGAALLGRRLGELHLALARGTSAGFVPEPFTLLWQRSLYQSLRSRISPTLTDLAAAEGRIDPELLPLVERIVGGGGALEGFFEDLRAERFDAQRIRVHADLHLGQVLLSGRDWVFLDFEGNPSRPLGERRLKRPALVDLAGLLRSFDYAVHDAVASASARGLLRAEQRTVIDQACALWRWDVAVEVIGAYRSAVAGSGIVPEDEGSFVRLLVPIVVDRLLQEVRHHLVADPARVGVSLGALDRMLGGGRL
jgi:maltose alpha-D-glucosyltransferase/alpha-amylase